MPNGEPEFGWRQYETAPIQHKAADRIEALEAALREIARPTYGTEINDTDAERADLLGRHLVRFQRIALEALKPELSKG